MKEIWKDIKGYEGLYQVSSLGNVRSLDRYKKNRKGRYLQKGRILNKNYDKDGYLIVGLYKNGKGKTKKIHRLVAEAFIPNPEDKPTINHKNGIRSNNCVENLEWATMSENQLHAYRVLNRDYKIPTKEQKQNYLRKKSKKVIQYEVQIILKEKNRYESMKEAERNTGVSSSLISRCCKNLKDTAGGFVWKFENDN